MEMEPEIENMTLSEYREMLTWRRLSNTTFDPTTPHTTPPDEDYVALATKSILDDLLKEFGDEILNVTLVDEGAECSPTKDLEELERLLAKYFKSHYTEIQVHYVIIDTEPFIHTQPMSPLYGTFKSFKSSTKPYKVDREMKSPFRGIAWDKVENPDPQSTPQVVPSFEVIFDEKKLGSS
ncbi:hypothetical protein Tco_0491171 [Tanacetum coccineum]